jgi:hypothetical protein
MGIEQMDPTLFQKSSSQPPEQTRKEIEAEQLRAFNSVFFEKGYKIYKVISALSKLLTDVEIGIGYGGLEMKVIDPNHTIFQSFKATGDDLKINIGKLKTGINLEDLAEIMKVNAGNMPSITLKLLEDDKDRIYIDKDIGDPLMKVKKRLLTLDIDSEKLDFSNLKDIDFTGKIVLNKKQLSQILYELKQFDTPLAKFELTDNEFRISEEGTVSDSSIIIPRDQLEESTLTDEDNRIDVTYGLDFLKMLEGLKPVIHNYSDIIIEIGDDLPLHVEIPLVDIDGDYEFYFAQREVEEQ